MTRSAAGTPSRDECGDAETTKGSLIVDLCGMEPGIQEFVGLQMTLADVGIVTPAQNAGCLSTGDCWHSRQEYWKIFTLWSRELSSIPMQTLNIAIIMNRCTNLMILINKGLHNHSRIP